MDLNVEKKAKDAIHDANNQLWESILNLDKVIVDNGYEDDRIAAVIVEMIDLHEKLTNAITNVMRSRNTEYEE